MYSAKDWVDSYAAHAIVDRIHERGRLLTLDRAVMSHNWIDAIA